MSDSLQYTLVTAIVNEGMASKFLNESLLCGATGGTILHGEGTVQSSLLEFLCLNETKKEILMMVVDSAIERDLLEDLNQKFQMHKANHGIVFSMPVTTFIGTRKPTYQFKDEEKGETAMGYDAIFTIVEKYKGEDVIDAAKAQGSTGGTIIHGRGAGIHDTASLFKIHLEPEKEVVLILSKKELTQQIVDGISEALDIGKPNHGVLFVMDVGQTAGIFDGSC